MDSKELQKFIVTFLILAILTSSGAFLYSLTLRRPNSNVSNEPQATHGKGASKTAFVEQVSPHSLSTSATITLESGGTILTTGNLTQDFASIIAYQTLDQDPESLIDSNGQIELALPDNFDAVLEQYASTEKVSPSEIMGKVDASRLKIKDGVDGLETYFSEINKILEEAQGNETIQNLSSVPVTEDLLSSVSVLSDEVRARLYTLPTPQPIAGFHVAFLEGLESQRKFLALMKNDPLRASLLVNAMTQLRNEQNKTLDREMQKFIEQFPELSMRTSEKESRLHALFGINKAHAFVFVPVFDPAHTKVSAAHWYETVYEFVLEVATEWLKNRLIREFVNMAVAWVTGGDYQFGDSLRRPRFVLNWESFLREAANVAAGAVVEQYAPQLCSRWGPLAQILKPADPFGAFNPGFGFGGGGCTLDRVVRNIKGFEQDFQNGGWVAYGAVLNPDNNFFWNIVTVSDAAERAAAAAKEAAKSKAESGAGFTGTEKKFCERGTLNEAGTACVSVVRGYPVMVGVPVTETTTPGKTLSDILSGAVKAPLDRIVNAQTYAALVGYLLDTLAAKLFTSGDEGITQRGITGKTPVTGTQACNAYKPGSEEYNDCIQNTSDKPPLETDDGPLDGGPGGGSDTAGSGCVTPKALVSMGGTAGTVTAVTRPGTFFTATDAEPRILIPISMPAAQNYKRVVVDLTVTPGPWYSAAEEKPIHNIFWLHRSGSSDLTFSPFKWGENVVGYLNLIGPESVLSIKKNSIRLGSSLNRDVDGDCISSKNSDTYVFKEGIAYRFVFAYDTEKKEVIGGAYLAGTETPVAVVRDSTFANIIQSNHPTDTSGGNGFFLVIGHDPADEGPGAPTIGWQYSNLQIIFEP